MPLGGLYTREEMSLEDNNNGNGRGMRMFQNSLIQPPKNKTEVTGNQQASETPVQQSSINNIEGVFILQSFEKGISPQSVPFAKLNVMDKATNEVSLVLVKENRT